MCLNANQRKAEHLLKEIDEPYGDIALHTFYYSPANYTHLARMINMTNSNTPVNSSHCISIIRMH